MGVVGLLVVLAVWLSAFCGASGAREPQRKVPPPTHITIDSYNFNTSVRWDYESMSLKPLFVVELRCYGSSVDMKIKNCINITQHYCDLTHDIDHRCNRFWVKVKAVSGLNESEYQYSDFHLIRQGRIGPPELNLSINNQEIQVDIKHPLTSYRRKSPLSIRRNLTDFAYRAFLWKRGNPEKRERFMAEECSDKTCTINLRVPSWNASYCVSAQGFSEMFSVEGEESKESCVGFSLPTSLDRKMPIILGITSFVLLMVFLGGICLWLIKKKRSITLPKSLAAIVRNINPVRFDIEPEGNYTSVITSSPIVPVCEDEKVMDPQGEVRTTDLSSCGKEAGADGSQEEEGSVHEGIIVEIPESEQSPEENDNYFKSLGGQEDSSTLTNLDLPKADMQQPMLPESCKIISDYDRHHWPPSVEDLLTT